MIALAPPWLRVKLTRTYHNCPANGQVRATRGPFVHASSRASTKACRRTHIAEVLTQDARKLDCYCQAGGAREAVPLPSDMRVGFGIGTHRKAQTRIRVPT